MDNGAEDRNPNPAVDPSGRLGIAWDRAGATMWLKVDRNGTRLLIEQILSMGNVPVQDSGFCPPCLAPDSKGSFHMVQEIGGAGAYYAKIGKNGDVIVPGTDIVPGAVNADDPALAVSPAGNVTVAYTDNRWCATVASVGVVRLYENGAVERGPVRAGDPGWDCTGVTAVSDRDGYIHLAVVTRSLTVWHVRLDPDGKQDPLVPPTCMYTISDPETEGPPSLACDGTGAVHVAWNDRPSGKGYLNYMKLDQNGTRLAAGTGGQGIHLTYSGTCKGYPSIVADRYDRSYVFWSDDRNGRPQIWRMMLQSAYLNYSTLPEFAFRLNTDDTGNQLEPKAARDPVGNVFVVWKDNRDGNFEIYFKFGYWQGIDLTMAQAEKERFLQVHPNHAFSGNLTLENQGGTEDVADFWLTADLGGHPGGTGTDYTGDGWKVWLSPPAPRVGLGYLEKKNVTVNVRGPAAGVTNDYIDVRVNATSRERPGPNHTVSFRAYLVMNHTLRLTCTDKVHSTMAGVSTVFTVEVDNKGSFDEVIDLSAEGPAGWGWQLWTDRVQLGAFKYTWISLNVTPPLDAAADEVGIVTVSGRFAEEPAASDSAVTHTVVRPVMDLAVWPDRTDGAVAPGNSTDFVLTVAMGGNIRTPVPVMLEASGDRAGWNVTLDVTSVSLAADESESVVLRVSAPADAAAGERFNAKVSCLNLERTVTASCGVAAFALQVRGFRVAVSPENASVSPGGKALFRFDVTNEGNGEDRFRPEPFSGPAGWSLVLPEDAFGGKLMTDGLLLGSGQTGFFEAIVGAPANATVGDYGFLGRVLDTAGDARLAPFSVTVDQVFGVAMAADATELSGEVGQRVVFTLGLRNRGNGPDTVRLSASALPDGWGAAELRDGRNVLGDTLELEAFAEGRMGVAVVIPATTPLNDIRFNVTAVSSGGRNATVALHVTVRKADLVIAGVQADTDGPVVGRPVRVRVFVRNVGEANASNVSMAYFRNGVLRTTENLGSILPGGNATAVFIWVPVDGKNSLRFVADPANSVCERNETGNEAAYEKWLYSEKGITLTDTGPIGVGVLVLSAFAVCAFLLRWVRRRARV